MKRKINFFDKLPIFKKFLKEEKGHGIRGVCSMCGSTKLDVIMSEEEKVEDCIVVYKASYQCASCGAVAEVKEEWFKTSE